MNSPLGKRKVRLRGLGGQALRGVPRTCASATEIAESVSHGHNSPLAATKAESPANYAGLQLRDRPG
jgi:hypothetical protein